jgi:CBS domain-containing protein
VQDDKERTMDLDGRNRVQRLAQRPAVYVHANDNLRRAASVLIEESIGAALVRGTHGAAGLISERDIIRALAEGASPDRTRVEEVMADELLTVTPNDELLDAVHRMLDSEVRHLPVVEDGVAFGMLSARDALRALVEETETV